MDFARMQVDDTHIPWHTHVSNRCSGGLRLFEGQGRKIKRAHSAQHGASVQKAMIHHVWHISVVFNTQRALFLNHGGTVRALRGHSWRHVIEFSCTRVLIIIIYFAWRGTREHPIFFFTSKWAATILSLVFATLLSYSHGGGGPPRASMVESWTGLSLPMNRWVGGRGRSMATTIGLLFWRILRSPLPLLK